MLRKLSATTVLFDYVVAGATAAVFLPHQTAGLSSGPLSVGPKEPKEPEKMSRKRTTQKRTGNIELSTAGSVAIVWTGQ